MILGITGGSGSGKTTLLDCIRDRGGLVLDCDAIYHTLLETDDALLSALKARFPEAFPEGTLQRKKLGSIVFSDPQALQELNHITHSAVKQEVLRQLEFSPALAAIDAYALFEGQLDTLCDLTVAICAPIEDRIKRLTARDGITEAYARSRISAQHDDRWFQEHCSVVLVNNADLCTFREKCVAFLDKLDIISVGKTFGGSPDCPVFKP